MNFKWAFVLAFMAYQSISDPQGTASVAGVVKSTVGDDPIGGADIILTAVGGARPGMIGGTSSSQVIAASGSSDLDGKFIIRGLQPKDYRVTVVKNGFVQASGNRSSVRSEVLIKLSAGEARAGLSLSMTPVGTISGQIRDVSGEPIVGTTLQVLRASYTSTGERVFRSVGNGRTDDRGNYRIYWVSPGRYYLVAGGERAPSVPIENGGPGNNPNEMASEGYPLTFYPGVTDFITAATVEITPGRDSIVGFTLKAQAGRTIQGQVIDSRTGKPTPSRISLTGVTMVKESPRNVRSTDGSFQIVGVFPGAYRLSASLDTSGGGGTAGASTTVTVGDSDLRDIALSLTEGSSISGKITSDVPVQTSEVYRGMRIRIQPSVEGSVLTSPGSRPGAIQPDLNGLFVINGIAAGEYRLSIDGVPPGFFVNQARFGGSDILTQPLRVEPRSGELVEILLSARGGTVNGRVTDDKRNPAAATEVVLIPDQGRARLDLFRRITTDGDGRFSISDLAPGGYRVVAWNPLDEPNAYFDPSFTIQYARFANEVRIVDGVLVNVNLTVAK